MGRLIEWNDRDKFRKRVADVLNISEVVKDGVTMADEEGVVDLSMLSTMQRDIDYIMSQIGIGRYLKASQNDDFILTSDGQRIELI